MEIILYFYKIQITLFFLGLLIFFIHEILKGLLWYRWAITSLVYPFNHYSTKIMVRNLNDSDKRFMKIMMLKLDKYEEKYWFGRKMMAMLKKELGV